MQETKVTIKGEAYLSPMWTKVLDNKLHRPLPTKLINVQPISNLNVFYSRIRPDIEVDVEGDSVEEL